MVSRRDHNEWGLERRLEPLLADDELPRHLETGKPGWRRFAGRISILLDGGEVKRCTGFDVDKSIVRVQRVNREGRIYLENGRVAEQTLKGRVEVRWK
jgi:hypothetical protein